MLELFLLCSERLPKTRSGKVMRRIIKAAEMGKDLGDMSALAD